MLFTQEKSLTRSASCKECGDYGYYHDLIVNSFIFKHIDLVQAVAWIISWYLLIDIGILMPLISSTLLTICGEQLTSARSYVIIQH